MSQQLLNLLGSAPGGTKTYVEDVFSTYLYAGNFQNNGDYQNIRNNISLSGTTTNGTVLQLTGDILQDSSPITKPTTRSGVSVNTSTKKFGTGSLYFNGTPATRLSTSSGDYNISGTTIDFTIEFWLNVNTPPGSYAGVVTQYNGGGNARTFSLELNSSNALNFYYYGDGVVQAPSTGNTLSTGTWYHIATGRVGGYLYAYINGTRVGYTASTALFDCAIPVCLGNYWTNYDYPLNGYIDDFRFTVGRSVYDGSASITVPTAALPLDSLLTEGDGGLVWLKNRTTAANHILTDTVRGYNRQLITNETGAQESNNTLLTSFNSDGFSLGVGNGNTNTYGYDYASWTFRKTPKFFDVVTYTGDGATNQYINHSLDTTPGCIILKRTDSTSNWAVRIRNSAGQYKDAWLNLTAASANTFNDAADAGLTSTTFNAGRITQTDGYGQSFNSNGATYVAYLFAHNAGGFGDSGEENIISCGSYTGNGSASGPVVDLGWEPQWVMIKSATVVGENWYITDSMRQSNVGTDVAAIPANESSAENTASGLGKIFRTATGFYPATSNSAINSSGQTYLYIAIRRGPMKTPTDATTVFTPIAGSSGAPTFKPGHITDAVMALYRPGDVVYPQMWDRLRGAPYLQTSSTNAEVNDGRTWDYMNGAGNFSGDSNYFGECFRRAPGFFDVVAYTGQGSSGRQKTHNLGVAPELLIVKSRSNVQAWSVLCTLNGGLQGRLNETTALESPSAAKWGDGSSYVPPTESIFTVGTDNETNASGWTYVAYLFASCPGVSKVGSYTGNGTTQTIDCGFSNGARFVLLKRYDVSGYNWQVFDTVRGITVGNDSMLALNTTSAESTINWGIDPNSSGFEVSGNGLNESGGSWIYLAIA